jgi:hypothetical protein
MRHDATGKVDETDVYLSDEHFCPPLPQVYHQGTVFLYALPDGMEDVPDQEDR